MTKINIFEVARISFIEGVRDRALHGILIIAVLFSGISLLIIPMFAFDTGKVAIDLGFAFVNLSGLSLVFFLAIPLLSRDVYQRTVTMILARPITRGEYICGKFLGLALLIALAFVVIGFLAIFSFLIGSQFFAVEVPRNFTWIGLSLTIVFAYLAQIIILAVAFLFATLTTSYYLAMLLTLAVYIAGQSLETIMKIITAGDFFRANVIHRGGIQLITWMIPNLRAFDLKVHASYGMPISGPYVLAVFGYGLFYTFLLLWITVFLFQRKELQ